jgi:hypothetical protein
MMKKILLGLGLISTFVLAQSCDEWYKQMRKKYHIVGTKTGIVMDKNGNWQKIFAKGTASVDFADEDEYEDALMEAEEKAKANIAHFLKEEITDEKFLNKVSKKLKEINSDGKNQTVKINKKTLTVHAQQIHNSASSLLKGILVLCESIDSKQKKAEVIVGVSPKTQRAADSARHSMYKDHTTGRSLTSSHDNSPTISTPSRIQDRMDASDSLDF